MTVSFTHVYIVAVVISLTGVQSWDRKWNPESLTPGELELLQIAHSPECLGAMILCAIPILVNYEGTPAAVMERVRNVELDDNCRITSEAVACFEQLIGKGICADMDPEFVAHWRLRQPIYSDIVNLVCQKRFKELKLHYRCLLANEAIVEISNECIEPALYYREKPSDLIECIGKVIGTLCGSEASKITEELLQTTTNNIVDIVRNQTQDLVHQIQNAELINEIVIELQTKFTSLFSHHNLDDMEETARSKYVSEYINLLRHMTAKYENEVINQIASKLQSEFISLFFHHNPEKMKETIRNIVTAYVSDYNSLLRPVTPEDVDEIIQQVVSEYLSQFFSMFVQENTESMDEIQQQKINEYQYQYDR